MASARESDPARRPIAFVGDRILAMDDLRPRPAVVVVVGDRIAATGDRSLLAGHPHAERVELGRRWLLPGFVDAHNHLSIAALHPLWADLTRVRDLDGLQDAFAAHAAREPDARWLRGFGWNEANGLALDCADLDALGFDRPVIVAHYTLHQCAVSSLGLAELAIGRTTRDPPGGHIARRPDGEPSGILLERAWSEAHARSVTAYRDRDRFAELFAARARSLLRDGITCVHDAACSPSAEEVYRRLARAGELPISVLAMPHAEGILAGLDASRLDGPPTGDGDEAFRVGPVKLFADGGAAPAIDACLAGSRVTTGIAFPDVEKGARAALERGFGVAVHAIGNVGLASALAAYRACDRLRARAGCDVRLRIEHAMLASPAQVAEIAALEAIAVVQPGFVHHVGAAVHGVEFDGETWLPFGSLARAGVRLAASSDDPCAFHEPLLTAARGATRRCASGAIVGPDEALAYEDWLRAYTIGAAYAGGQEHERGSLTPGKRADLVVLEGDLDPERPPRVAETWVGGRRRFPATAEPDARSLA
ncbi:MAG TPA: amidohydrolase family protein [Candidatus Binatia bacterium]|nr:amidohydrolase family protein [Candidatus Binatia bacterium]